MNTLMWSSPFTQRHLDTLMDLGAVVVPPVAKKLACGDVGLGAMASPEAIASVVEALLRERQQLPQQQQGQSTSASSSSSSSSEIQPGQGGESCGVQGTGSSSSIGSPAAAAGAVAAACQPLPAGAVRRGAGEREGQGQGSLALLGPHERTMIPVWPVSLHAGTAGFVLLAAGVFSGMWLGRRLR